MPKAPDQIDALIKVDIEEHTTILNRLERERTLHERKRAEMEAMLDCEHESEFYNTRLDRCRHCGYAWVR